MKKLALFAALFLVELVGFTLWLDGASLAGRGGIPAQIGAWGPWVLRAAVCFAAVFAAFAGMQGQVTLAELYARVDRGSQHVRWMFPHVFSLLSFTLLSAALYGNWSGVTYPNILAAAWIAAAAATPVTLLGAFVPWSVWPWLRERSGTVWLYASAVALLAMVAFRASQSLWHGTAQVTFRLVERMLRPMFPDLIAQPEQMRLALPHFDVTIAETCSGLEGAGLMVVFIAVWLLLFRRDFRFPRALLLLPAGVATLYLLNAVRIAALLIIGNAGAEAVALGGFHSQAGWIAFNGVALAMTYYVPGWSWMRRHPRPVERTAVTQDNPTATYLLPFLAILAAGMLSRAMSADFEWPYALRFVATLGVLVAFRRDYALMNWRAGWRGLAGGVGVYGLWVGLDLWHGTATSGMPATLAMAGASVRVPWIVARALAAVTTVPIAEELAFRGFAMRRWQSVDFENVPYERSSWTGVVVSSLLFGFLHGDRWIAGVLAGFVFAGLARKTGRIGEAVLAHSVANALLAATVLGAGQWQYW